MTIRNSNLLWKTLAQAKGATSIGTPWVQLVPNTFESFLESATIMKWVAASAKTFSRRWHLLKMRERGEIRIFCRRAVEEKRVTYAPPPLQNHSDVQ